MLQKVETLPRDLQPYREWVDDETFRDLERLAARDRHELLRCWELVHRAWVGEAHMRHLLFRKETRWPGFYYRSDYPDMDQENWTVFVNSRYDPESKEWTVFARPCINIFK